MRKEIYNEKSKNEKLEAEKIKAEKQEMEKLQDKYLDKVLEQIRCKKARPYIAKELESHLEDQITDNIKAGMSKEKAEQEAVRDMGDPVETGVELDRIHRPQIAWKLLILVGLLSVLGIIVHTVITKNSGVANLISSKRYIAHVAIGIAVMCGIYFLDYTWIARHAKKIGVVLMAACILASVFGINIVNGNIYWPLYISGHYIFMKAFILLYVPVYGGIIYHYHGSGYGGLIKSVLWLLLPVFIMLQAPAFMTASTLAICMLVMLTVAVLNDWFHVSKTKAIAGIWGISFVAPAVLLAVLYFGDYLSAYHKARITAWNDSGNEMNYIANLMHNMLKQDQMIGANGVNISQKLPDYNADYLLTYLSATYGILAGICICAILAILILAVFRAAVKQKNQLGMLMGCGCGMVLLTNFLINVLINTGTFPTVMTFLPFLSAGGNYIVVCYAMLGIVLSVYKNKNIYPKYLYIGKQGNSRKILRNIMD